MNIKKIANDVKIPIQGGLDPKILLTNKKNIEKKANYYLSTFRKHPYIFNLGHGVLPKTDPNVIEFLIRIVKKFK